MAGGDLLYIVAFIILPTAVLVSCIWALILLRNGTLLPARPAPPRRHDISQETIDDAEPPDDGEDLVEETGEHVVVEPVSVAAQAVAAPVAVAPEQSVTTDGEERGSVEQPAAVAVTPVMHADDGPPPTERTQELEVMPVDATDRADEPAAPSASAVAEPVAAQPAAVEATDDAAPEPATDATGVAGASSVLMVPLDEPSSAARPEAASAASTPPASSAELDADRADAQPPSPASSPGPRRPVRRVAQLRAADDAPPRPRTGQRRGARRSERG